MNTMPSREEISAMTPDQATTLLADMKVAYDAGINGAPAEAPAHQVEKLIADSDWRTRYLAGGVKEQREMQALLIAKSSGDRLDRILAGSAPVSEMEVTANGELSTYKQMQVAADLRELGISHEAMRELFEGRPRATKAEYDAVVNLKADLLANKEFMARYLSGDREAVRKMTLANIVIVGGFKDENAAA